MFTDRLKIALTITVGGNAHTLPSANVRSFELDLQSFGFSGSVEFVVFDDQAHGGQETDAVLADFVKQDLLEVSLGVSAVHADPETADAIEAVTVKGIGTEKSVEESAVPHQDERSILYRTYRVRFADPAWVLWKQHFPVELYTQKSMQDVIDAHKGAKITMTYDWTALAAQAPMLFLNLDPTHGASFYDFLAWYTDARAGVLAYDYATQGYKLSAAKDAAGTAVSLFGDDVGRLLVVFPEVARARRNVLSSYTESIASKAIDNAMAVEGLRQDTLIRTPIAQRVDDRVTLETSRLVLRKSELALDFRRWPTVTFRPGSLVSFVHGNLWSAGSLALTPTWRVRSHSIRARASDDRPDADHNFTSAGYDLEISARLEQQDEKHVALPPFVKPRYPGYFEGKVVSEQGEDAHVTYQFYTDQDTSLDEYKVKIPLWSDQVITAPYAPHQGSGNVYIPAYRNARVLIAMNLGNAWIDHLLDWREGVRLAMDAQGEQVLFGKTATSQTSINHVYDGDNPVFNIARTHEKDRATIQIKEGSLIIQVKEDS